MMRTLTFDESRAVQLKLLKTLDAFCEENNIKYSLAYGTLIGAIRHKGYIPWDDDVDVVLLREEYEKLIKLFKETDSVGLAALECNPKWNRPYAKLYYKRTLSVEQAANNTGIGLGIDVFPIDKIPVDKNEQQSFRKKLFFIRNLYLLKSLSWSSERGLIKNLIIMVSHILLLPLSFRGMAKRISKLSQKYTDLKEYMFSDNTVGYETTAPYLAKSFDQYIRAPFEDMDAMIVEGYDDLLTKDYGDYMEMPSSEKRVSHHRLTNYWK